MSESKTRLSPPLRKRVAQRANFRCGYCLTEQRISGCKLTVDHILPESKGGKSDESNLWLACVDCNQIKGSRFQARDLETKRQVRLFNPCRQIWREHFKWSDDGTKIIGLTPRGRATVLALQMNRPELVFARRLWVQVGWWPPLD
jgi:hypothetical protein